MKTYEYKSEHFGFQILIPDGWSGKLIDLFTRLLAAFKYSESPPGRISDTRTLLGPKGKYLNILITPLGENEPESTIEETERYFEGLAYRESLHVIETGSINVENKDHFWVTYYRWRPGQVQFFKKYCLLLNRAEYLITAGLWFASSSEKLPNDQQIKENEEVYDEIVASFKLLKG